MDACELTPVQTGELECLQSDCRGLRKSSNEMLRSVWDEVTPELARLACALGIPPARAEDILQDVYLTAWRKQPSGIDRLDLRRWLIKVTTNLCNLEHRRRSRWQNVFGVVTRLWSGHEENHARRNGEMLGAICGGEQRELVRSALARLDPQLRSVLVLRYFAGFDSKEIGKTLEISDSTVRSQLRAARSQLALELRRAGYSHE